MVLKLSKGNEVLITGGIYGTIAEINDKTILLDISMEQQLRFKEHQYKTFFQKTH